MNRSILKELLKKLKKKIYFNIEQSFNVTGKQAYLKIVQKASIYEVLIAVICNIFEN